MILFNSVSRPINVSNILFLLSVPLESLSKSFLKALYFSLSYTKKRCPWAFCTKKGKNSKLSVQRESNDSLCKQSSMYSVVKSGVFVPQGLDVMWTCAFKSTIPIFHDKSFQICCLQYSINPLPWSHTVHDHVY